MEPLDDELGYYMDCMAGRRCFICSIARCGKNGAKEILVLGFEAQVPLMNEVRIGHTNIMKREDWERIYRIGDLIG